MSAAGTNNSRGEIILVGAPQKGVPLVSVSPQLLWWEHIVYFTPRAEQQWVFKRGPDEKNA